MIALWALYATAVGALLAAAACALEPLAAARDWPRRWVWLAAMLAVPVMPLLTRGLPMPLPAPVATANSGTSSATAMVALASDEASPIRMSGPASSLERMGAGGGATDLTSLTTALARRIYTGLGAVVGASGWLAALWSAAALILIAGYVAAAARLSIRRRHWPRTRIDGDDVLLAPDVGPAVIGTVHPAIVLPAWTLTIDDASRSLIVAHEREHLRARDPLVLHVTTVCAYLMPWNVPMWWMLRRLRIAIEIDCDRRVVRSGHDAARYAELLIAVGHRRSFGARVLAPALMERRSLLHRRILAMCPSAARFRSARLLVAAGSACVLIATACEIPHPASAPDAAGARDSAPAYTWLQPTYEVHLGETQPLVLDELQVYAAPAPVLPAAPVLPRLEDLSPATPRVTSRASGSHKDMVVASGLGFSLESASIVATMDSSSEGWLTFVSRLADSIAIAVRGDSISGRVIMVESGTSGVPLRAWDEDGRMKLAITTLLSSARVASQPPRMNHETKVRLGRILAEPLHIELTVPLNDNDVRVDTTTASRVMRVTTSRTGSSRVWASEGSTIILVDKPSATP